MSERIQVNHPHETSLALHRARYDFAANHVLDKVILDVACGVGYGSQILAKTGAKHVTGVDIDPASVEEAKAHYALPNTNFLVASAEKLPFPDDSFDLAVSFETIEHLANPTLFIDELYRVLRPGGSLIISTPNRELTAPVTWLRPGNRFHRFEVSLGQFTGLVSRRFKDLSFYGQQSIAAHNLKKFKQTQAYSQVLRYIPERLVDKVKSSRPGILDQHRRHIGDLHQSNDPRVIQVYPVDQLPFVRYMIIVAQK